MKFIIDRERGVHWTVWDIYYISLNLINPKADVLYTLASDMKPREVACNK